MRGLRKGGGGGVARLSPHDATWLRTGEEMSVAVSVHAHFLFRSLPCCIMRWGYSNPAAIYLPQSPHVTLSLFLSLTSDLVRSDVL